MQLQPQQSPAPPSPIAPEDLDVVFVDCDDCLYFNEWSTANHITRAINSFTQQRLGLEDGYAWRLYKRHGTALRGLLAEGLIPPDRVEEYLHAVHNVPLGEISFDPELREMFTRLRVKKRWIFTASTREHAMRCMRRVGVEDLFEGIVDCRDVDLVTKHDPASFMRAMEVTGAKDPSRCLLLDDSIANIKTAKRVGMKTALVGFFDRSTGERVTCAEADVHVARLLDMQDALPHLFAERLNDPLESARLLGDRSQQQQQQHHHHHARPQVVIVLGAEQVLATDVCNKLAKTYLAEVVLAQSYSDGGVEAEAVVARIKERVLAAERVLLVDFPRTGKEWDAWNRLVFDHVHVLGIVLLSEAGVDDALLKRLGSEYAIRRILQNSASAEEHWQHLTLAVDGWWVTQAAKV